MNQTDIVSFKKNFFLISFSFFFFFLLGKNCVNTMKVFGENRQRLSLSKQVQYVKQTRTVNLW